jgi:hypothetical protein
MTPKKGKQDARINALRERKKEANALGCASENLAPIQKMTYSAPVSK